MITLALTTWNRDSLTVNSFRYVLNDDRITEIVIVDDCSDERIYNNLSSMVDGMPKVKLYRNEKNLGCYHNKRKAVELSSNEWVILFDSDNVIKPDYLDAIDDVDRDKDYIDTIFQPEFAKPHFDFRSFSGMVISKENVNWLIAKPHFTTMLNAMNFFVNREEFLKVFDQAKEEPWTADSIYFNYLWLKAGNAIYVTPGMQYEHLVHEGSHYKANVHKTGNFFNEVINMLKRL